MKNKKTNSRQIAWKSEQVLNVNKVQVNKMYMVDSSYIEITVPLIL